LGSVIGAVIGVVASLQLTAIIRVIEKMIGHQFLSGDIYFIDFLPSELRTGCGVCAGHRSGAESVGKLVSGAPGKQYRSGEGIERTIIKSKKERRCITDLISAEAR
jgi:hypothetical protein